MKNTMPSHTMHHAAILALSALVLLACKPEAPNLHDQRRPAATQRAEAAKAAIAAGKTRASEVAGLTDEQAAAVVARVGDRTITLGDVGSYISQLPRSARSRYVTPEQQVDLIRHLVDVELLAHESERRGFGSDSVVQHSYKKALANELLKTVATDLSLAEVSEEDVKAYYEAHKDDYVRPERRRCAIIQLDTKAEAETTATALAQAIEATPKAAKQIFGDWAREKSVDQDSAKLKGDLGWFDAKGLNNKGQRLVSGITLEAVYQASRVHEVVGPLELESSRWFLVQLTGLEVTREAPMADVQLKIQNTLLKARRSEARKRFIDELRAKATIEMDEAALATLPKPEAPPQVVPPVPKPKLNPALFRRRLNDGMSIRPGKTDDSALSLDKGKHRIPRAAIDSYLNHRASKGADASDPMAQPGKP